jgi:hypothetical protein
VTNPNNKNPNSSNFDFENVFSGANRLTNINNSTNNDFSAPLNAAVRGLVHLSQFNNSNNSNNNNSTSNSNYNFNLSSQGNNTKNSGKDDIFKDLF